LIPTDIATFLNQLQADMRQARILGLYRTTEALHAALSIAYAEWFEVAPSPAPPAGGGTFTIGPVTEQPRKE
jgi:hypothetical protein